MSETIFRKASLERLSSPEQLDVIMRVTGPRRWLALAGLFIVLGATVVWGYAGSIDTKVSGSGIIVRAGTVLNVVTEGAGLVTSISANLGDLVKANQVVARVSEPAMLEKIRLARSAVEEVRAERERNLLLHQQGAQLQVEALARDEANAQREIQELQQQAKIAGEQITVDDQLLGKGLITKQQTLQDQQKLVTINGEAESLKAKIKRIEADQYTARTDPQRFDVEMQSRLAELERNLSGLEHEMEISSSVVSPYEGQVIELKAVPGALVAVGAPILAIQPQGSELEVLVYIPSLQAKAVAPGMDAEVSPSTVKREEFGFIRAKVVYVGQFPASFDALMRNFQNETLVNSIMKEGPVTELRVILERDPNTQSGFKWSSSRGPAITITSGTLGTVQVITRKQSPASLLLPYFKNKVGLG
ncbi:MAG TPA: NHLP bacteriocin system secretion protein [Terriglobales bacterium]|nr:NHLP bacteriocin system secretion protein [Terriglobales bacterium]